MAQPAGSAKRRKRTGGCPLPYRIHFEKQDPADSDQPSGSCFVSAPCSLVRHPPSWQAPGTSCFPQAAGSRGGRRCPPQAMVPFCGSDQRNPGGSGHSVFRSPPKTAITPPRRRRHAALCISFFGFPLSPRMCCPLLRSCIRRRISEPDPGSRFFSFVKYVMYSRSRVSGGGAHRFPQGKSH